MAKRRTKDEVVEVEPELPPMPPIWAWIIESEQGRYIGETRFRGDCFPGWVKSKGKALRFFRRKDAVAMARMCYGLGIPCGEGITVLEHCFGPTE